LLYGFGGYCRLDSLAVTARGSVCVATLERCSIAEIEANGATVRHHSFPDMLVTNICFGGDDMRSAYVTLSYTGKLAKTVWPSAGLRLS
jgi:gluconolactonase